MLANDLLGLVIGIRVRTTPARSGRPMQIVSQNGSGPPRCFDRGLQCVSVITHECGWRSSYVEREDVTDSLEFGLKSREAGAYHGFLGSICWMKKSGGINQFISRCVRRASSCGENAASRDQPLHVRI